MVTGEPAGAEQYDAFISYSIHDSEFARVLEKALEDYKPPPGLNLPSRYLRIFRFEGDMTGVEYDQSIQDKIQQSAKLIVICSPAARQKSEYIDDEIRRFVQAKGAGNIIPVIVSGIPNNEAKRGQETEMAFPDALCQVQKMPLGTDYRRFNRRTDQVNKGNFSNSWYKLLADLLDRSREEIEQRDHKRQIRRRNIAMAIVSSVMIVLAGLSVYAWMQKFAAVTQAKIALARQLAAQAELLHVQNPEFLERSTLLSIQAIRLLHSIETDQALRSNLEILPRRLVLLKHTNPITMLALSHDRKYLAASSTDKVVRVWEFPLGRQVASLSHLDLVTKIAFSPVGHLFVTGTEEGKAVVWELPSGKHWRSLDLKGRIDALDFSPDGHTIVVGGPEMGVRLWSLGSDPAERVLAADKVIAATFRSDSRFVATAVLEVNRVRIWDTKKMTIALELPQTDAPHDLAFSPDGRYLAVASGFANQKESDAIWLWDVQKVRRVARLQQEGYIRAIHFSPDGSLVAATADDGFARVWRTASGEAVAAFTHGAPYAIRSIAWSADGQCLATSSTDRTARVWNVRSGREIARMTHGDTVNVVMFSPDPPYLVTASGGPFPYWLDRSVGIWELPPGTEHVRLVQPAGANSIVFSPDGRMVATSNDDGIVRLFKVPSREILTTFNHRSAVNAIAFGPKGEWFAAALDRRTYPEPRDDLVWVWDLSRQKEVLRIPHPDLVRSIAVSPDGHYLATGGGGGTVPKTKDQSVHVWEMPSGRPVATIPAASDVLEVGFSRDGKLGASIERTGILTLWRPESGTEVKRLNIGVQAYRFAFDYSGHRLAVATLDSARIYDMRNLQELHRIPHESFVNAVAFSPDDRYLASGDSGKSAHVWDLNENREIARFYHDEIVSSVAFSQDGRLLATAGFGKAAHLWLWRREDLVAEACARLTRDLTKQEWRQYLGGELQHPTCNRTP